MSTSTVVNFTVSGEFITNHFRDQVLEGRWSSGLKGLMDSLVDLNMQQAVDVLSGEKKFIGIDELELVEEDKNSLNYLSWKETYDFMFSGIFTTDRVNYYKPYIVIQGAEWSKATQKFDAWAYEKWRDNRTGWLETVAKIYSDYSNDRVYIMHNFHKEGPLLEYNGTLVAFLFKRIDTPPFWTKTFNKELDALLDYLKYCKLEHRGYDIKTQMEYGDPDENESEVVETVIPKDPEVKKPVDVDSDVEEMRSRVISHPDPDVVDILLTIIDNWEIKRGMEEWSDDIAKNNLVTLYKDINNALDKSLDERNKKGIEIYEENKRKADEEKASYEALIVKLRKEVIETADSYLYGKYGYFTLTLEDGREYKIPKPPFENWALRDTCGANLAIPWIPISPSGLKMDGDDPFHTDWMVGTTPQISTEEWYGVEKDDMLVNACFEERYQIQKNKLNFEIQVISGTGKTDWLKINKPEPGQNVPEDCAIVVPDLGACYLTAAKSAFKNGKGVVIGSSGGTQLEHLVIASKMYNPKIIVIPNAINKIGIHGELRVDLDKGKIELR